MCKISFCIAIWKLDLEWYCGVCVMWLLYCVNQSWWEEFERRAYNSNFSLVIVKARTEVWLPINLTQPWSDSFAVSHLVTAVQTLLHRSRRMLGVVIASVLTVVSTTATAAVAGLALHQGIQTADFIWDWHKDSLCYGNNSRIWMHNLLPTCSIFNTPFPGLEIN